MTPHPAIDISSKDILFPQGQDLNDLLRQNVLNPNFAGNYAKVSAKISSLVEMGSLPVAFIDHESKKIGVSVAHFKPDDLEYRLVATLNLESSLLETRLFDLKGKESPSFFLNNLRYKDLIKGSFEAVDKIRISTKSTNDESIAAISAIALPVSLIPILSSVSYPIDPKIFLEKISLFLRDSNVTMTEKKNFRKVSDHVLDLFTFAASACLIEKDSLDSGCVKFTALEEVPEITPDRSEKFLKAVDYKITLEEDDYHNQLSEEEEVVESDDIYSRKSSRSIPLSSINDSPPAENKAETPAIEKLSKILLTGLVNQQENRIVVNSSSTHILEKENKEDLKEELLYFQSKDGENPETVVDPVTMKFYKNTVSGMAASLNKNSEVIEVAHGVLQSLQHTIWTSKNSRVTPEGISIFGLKPRKEGGLKTANLEGLSEAVVKATLSDDQLKSLVTTKIELPESVFHLLELLKMFKVVLRTFAGPESYILRQYSSFLAEIQELQVDVHRLFEDEGDVFILSLIQAINTEVASFVNRCTKHKVTKISFDHISDHIRKGTFMNNCRISIPTLAQSSNSFNNSSNNSSSKSQKRKPQGNDTQIPGKRLKILVSSPYPDLVWNEWKTRANQQVRNQNGIHLPQMRNRTICPRFYFEGNCIHEKCVNSRGHFVNLSSVEKSQIIALKNKCIECTNQAKMDPVQVLFDDFHMKSKYDSESEKVPLTEDEENCIQKEELSKPKEEKDDEEKATSHEEKVLEMIQKILNTPSPSFKESPFIFENTRKARIHNSKIIEKFDFDFKAAMESMERSVIHPGSEFRESELLEPLLKNHPDWEILKEIMDLGVDLGLDPSKTRDEATRLKDFEEALKKGNSGTMKDKLAQETVAKNQEKEVRYGRTIPITIECARQLKNGSLTPLGCAVQWTINEKNEKVIKRRTTHNLSFEWLSGLSVNSSVDPESLEEIIYGHCLYRCIHIMHQMRLKYPKVEILMSKFDIDSAFRRLHSWCDHAPLYLATLPSPDFEDELTAFLDVRMPFGANQGPGKFGIVSETATDIANYLMKNKAWDPEKLKSSFSKDIPDKELLDEMVEFGKALPLLADVQDFKSYWDVFVDDLINLTLNGMGLEGRAREAAAIALELLFRPKVENEEVERNSILKWEKLVAEGKQEEVKIILGWLINSRSWRIFIPDEKAKRWIIDFDDLILKGKKKERIYRKELESIIGKANEAAVIARELRFFLSRLRFRLKCAITHGSAYLHLEDIQDLQLLRRSIEHLATKGRSLNHVSTTLPSLFMKQDASSTVGMGGFNDLGFAWKIILHPDILDLFHINSLEHLAGVTNIWMASLLLHLNGDGNGMKFLDQSDNMTALAWMFKTSYFDSRDKADSRIREIISRKLADLLGAADIGIYLQHIPGIENIIADILSRHRNDSNSQIHSLLQKEAGEILKDAELNIKIVDVPEPIISWIESIVEDLMRIKELPPKQKRKIRSILENGGVSQPEPDLKFSSITKAQKEGFKSSVLSRSKSELIDLAKRHSINLEEILLKQPSTMFQRPSSRMDFLPLS